MKFTLSTAAAVLAFTSSAFALAPHPARRSASQPQPSVDPRLQKAVDDVWLAKMHVAAIDMCDKSGMLFDFDKKGVDFMCSLAGGKMQPIVILPILISLLSFSILFRSFLPCFRLVLLPKFISATTLGSH